MLQFSSAVKTLLASGHFSTFILLDLPLSFNTPATVREGLQRYDKFTTLPADITVGGLGTYLSEDLNGKIGLLTVDNPRQSTSLDRDTYRIVFADPDFFLFNEFIGPITNKKVTIRIGFINTLEETLAGFAPGEPLNHVDHLILTYEGFVDSCEFSHQDGAIHAILSCGSPMANLDHVCPVVTSKDYQRNVDPNDTAYDAIYKGHETVNILWGKEK
jgi:hypothetical protein